MTLAFNDSTTHASDVRLRDALVDGDARAWAAFYESHGRLIRASIARIVRRFGISRDSEDVRDIEGTFAVELLQNDRAKLRAFSPDRGVRFSTWIAMLASHAAYDHLRRRRRDPATETLDAVCVASEYPDPHTACEIGERARLVERLVSEFTTRDRTFLELYFTSGLEPSEVAEQMGISIKTVYSKKHKIQGRLESLLSVARAA
jgi:RNA polymerase sigma-70 factor (ECF subfamily)